MALFGSSAPRRRFLKFCRYGQPIFQLYRNRSFIQRKLVSRDECLKMSRTSGTDFQSILTKMNLIEQWPDFRGSTADIQILKSSSSALGHLYIRPGKSFTACHRLELIIQRFAFMSKMGFTSKEKLCSIKKNPPLLVLARKTFCDSSHMAYLRGLLREGPTVKYLFYPVFPRTHAKKTVLDKRLNDAASSVSITREQLLNIVMSLPCISISTNSLEKYKEKIALLHLKTLPKSFDIDAHFLDVYPPVCSQSFEKLRVNINEMQNEDPYLQGVEFPDLLDTSYSTSNGPVCPEDLTEFLLRSHCEERQYLPPVNFKQKKIPRKQRRFSDFSAFKDLMNS